MTPETNCRRPNVKARYTWGTKNVHSTGIAAMKSAKSNVSASVGRRSAAEVSNRLVLSGERVVCIGRLHYLVKSKSEDGWHCVDLEWVSDDDPDGGCTCTGFRARKDCRHVRAIRKHLGLEPTQEV